MSSVPAAVLICFDDHYAPAACVMLTSLFANNRDVDFELFAILDDVRDERRAVIAQLAESYGRAIHFLEIDERRFGFFQVSHHLTHAAYLRIFGPDVIEAARILYLDVDLIVQADISALLDLEMDGNVMAAALDNNPSRGFRERLGLSPSDPYVNSGVLVIDADAWRRADTTRALIDYYMKHWSSLYWADQDLLNACLAGKIRVLDPHWNLLHGDIIAGKVTCSDFDPVAYRGILHFNSPQKPWHGDSRGPYRALYDQYADQAPIQMEIEAGATAARPGRPKHAKAWKKRSKVARKVARRLGWKLSSPVHQTLRGVLRHLHGPPTTSLDFPQPPYSIHMVTCHADVDLVLWSLKSFTRFAELSPQVFIHDDGTLTERDLARLRRHVARCTVIRRSESDTRMDDWLRDYPHCRRARRTPDFYCALKLFDPWFYAPHDVVLLLDSDVLFFRRPEELLDHARRGRPCFNSDYQDSYAAPRIELQERLGMRLFPAVNAGLAVIPRRVFDLDFAEHYFASSTASPTNRDEQTIYAGLLSKAGARRLSKAYGISTQPMVSEAVSHHFVSDGSRPLFWTKGALTLAQRRALSARPHRLG